MDAYTSEDEVDNILISFTFINTEQTDNLNPLHAHEAGFLRFLAEAEIPHKFEFKMDNFRIVYKVVERNLIMHVCVAHCQPSWKQKS